MTNKQAQEKLKAVAAKAVDNFDPNMFVETRDVLALLDELEAKDKSIRFLKDQLAELANFNPDWDKLEASYESWREIAAELLVAKDRIAELEAREVILPKLPTLGSDAEWYQGFAAGAEGMRNDCLLAITAAGFSADRIRINGEG